VRLTVLEVTAQYSIGHAPNRIAVRASTVH